MHHWAFWGICRGILLKRKVFVHLKACFPKFDELIAEFHSPAFYKNHFQVDEDGRKLGDAPEQEADQGADTDDEDNMSPKKGAEDENDDASTYKSRAMRRSQGV